jgi:2-polyprenyl-3-methyl-5-hydroxy-6-metoxy-1,4-benzoquinol methylase
MLLQRMTECRICGVPSERTPSGRMLRGYPLLGCGHCGALQIKEAPTPAELKALYDGLFEDGDYAEHRKEFEALRAGKASRSLLRERFLGRVERECRGRRLVEIGGGTGKFGVAAKSRGWNYRNYDISEVAVDFCRQLGLEAEAFPPNVLPPLKPKSADAIVMWEVLEHIWLVHDYLRLFHDALDRGGVLFLSVPNYRTPSLKDEEEWNVGVLSSPPIHVNFFDEPSMQSALREAGFSEVAVFPRRVYRPTLSVSGFLQAVRYALLIDEPPVLYALAKRT